MSNVIIEFSAFDRRTCNMTVLSHHAVHASLCPSIPHVTIARQSHVQCRQRVRASQAVRDGAAEAVVVEIPDTVARGGGRDCRGVLEQTNNRVVRLSGWCA